MFCLNTYGGTGSMELFILLYFLFTVFSSIILAVWGASCFWKEQETFKGFLVALSMIVVGVLMLVVFDFIQPRALSADAYVILIYSVSNGYFFVQLLLIKRYIKKKKRNQVLE